MQGVVSRLGRNYELIPCTKRAVFESTLPTLGDAGIIVTSVLANFICDAGLLSPERILDQSNAELTSHIQSLIRFSLTNPSVRIVVVPPLAWSVPEWYNPYLPCLTTFLFGEITKSGRPQISYLSPFVAPPQYFTSDGIHLNQDAGVQFIRFIVDGVDQVCPPVDSNDSQPSEPVFPQSLSQYGHSSLQTTAPSIPSSSAPVYPPVISQFGQNIVPGTAPSLPALTNSAFTVEYSRISAALESLTGLTGTLRDETRTRREQDNLIFARLKEDRDFEFNKNREDRFTITGFAPANPPHDPKERREFFRLKLQELVDQACPAILPRPLVKDVFVNMRWVHFVFVFCFLLLVNCLFLLLSVFLKFLI